ncbi:hypothetical protein ZHAS_00014311 [Anopheles sinensis]|uniref:STAS domain-containing protein n=1 Tax=Anopheles sinensis TaxID=74873 RepID=A0A084W7X6_ANOSI|nr:hypothetical protein ZHAS_00014311 [Anopheles sinensis]
MDMENGVFNGSSRRDSFDHREDFPNVGSLIVRHFRGIWTKDTLYRRLPVLQWAPSYGPKSFISDLIAGITVGLTSIPQSIAYATVANLEPQYGLYSNFMGSFVYAFLGSVKEITVAPTAVMALMVQQPVLDLGPAGAILSSFLSGCIMLLLGCLNFGFVVQFISMPVITGFITAAAITIISSQLKSLMGISSSGKSSEFVDTWINLYENIGETRLWDSVLGFTSLSILILLTLIKGRGSGRWKTFTKYLCLLRNATIVLSGGIIAYICSTQEKYPFKLTGKVASGLPSFQLPPFQTDIEEKHYDFIDMIRTLGTSVISIPLISILEIVSIGKAFSRGKLIDATQEMLSLGCCNVAGSFVSSIPTTASFARSAINSSSGVVTPFGGVFTGILVLLALGLLTDYFYYIPKTTLAAVIIAAMMFIIEYRAVAEMWRTKRIDIVPFFVNDTTVLIVRPDSDLAFSSAEYFREKILKLVTRTLPHIILIDGEWVKFVDSTVVRNLSSTISDLRQQGRHVLLWRWDKNIRNAMYRFKKHKFMPLFRNDDMEQTSQPKSGPESELREDVPNDNPETYCRLCFSETNVHPLFPQNGSLIRELTEKIRNCAGIQISVRDDYPAGLCFACLSILDEIHQFQQRSKHCDEIIRTKRGLLEQITVKVEMTEEDGVHFVPPGGGSCGPLGDDYTNDDCLTESSIIAEAITSLNGIGELMGAFHSSTIPATTALLVKSEGEARGVSKEHRCMVCSKLFPDREAWMVHLGDHAEERPYQCMKCLAQFREKRSLARHLKAVHEEVRDRQCPYCPKSFKYSHHLRYHIRTHTGEKPYMCEICSDCFSQHIQWKRHMAKHQQIRKPQRIAPPIATPRSLPPEEPKTIKLSPASAKP